MPELAASKKPESEETTAMHQRMTQLFRDFYSHGMPPINTAPSVITPQQYSTVHNINAQDHLTSEGESHDNKD